MFFKKKTTPQIVEFIDCIVLEKTEKDSVYYLTLEDFRKRYGNHYLWDYIQRDVIVSILSDFSVYIFTPDKENTELKDDFEKIYPCKESKDGTVFLYCDRIDYRIVTELIEAYSFMWDFYGMLCFMAYSEKDAKIDFEQLMNYEQLKGYVLKIVTMGDDTGIEITIDTDQISETILAERIRSVADKYKIELKFI